MYKVSLTLLIATALSFPQQTYLKTLLVDKSIEGYGGVGLQSDEMLFFGMSPPYMGGSGYPVYGLVKPDGQIAWWKMDLGQSDEGIDILVAKDGNPVVFRMKGNAYSITKCDINGNTLWDKQVPFRAPREYNCATALPDGGFLLAGCLDTNEYVATLRLNDKGEAVAETIDSLDKTPKVHLKIVPVEDSCYLILGQRWLSDDYCGFVQKLNRRGSSVWSRNLPYIYDRPGSALLAADSGYYLCGNADKNGNSGNYLIRLRPNGDTLWTRYYATNLGKGFGCYLIYTKDGNLLLIGSCGKSISIFKINLQGDLLWKSSVTASDAEEVRARYCYEMQNGDYMITGFWYVWASGYRLLVVRTTPNGEVTTTRERIPLASKPSQGVISSSVYLQTCRETYVGQVYSLQGKAFDVDSKSPRIAPIIRIKTAVAHEKRIRP
jgi:hypothetical protein